MLRSVSLFALLVLPVPATAQDVITVDGRLVEYLVRGVGAATDSFAVRTLPSRLCPRHRCQQRIDPDTLSATPAP